MSEELYGLWFVCGIVIGMFITAMLASVYIVNTVDGVNIADYPIKQTICNNPSDYDYELPSNLVKDCMRMTDGELREYWKEMYFMSCNPRDC